MSVGYERNRAVVGLDEWVRLMWAVDATEDERVRQAWDQAVSSCQIVMAPAGGEPEEDCVCGRATCPRCGVQ